MCDMHLCSYDAKLPNLKLKTGTKQVLGSLKQTLTCAMQLYECAVEPMWLRPLALPTDMTLAWKVWLICKCVPAMKSKSFIALIFCPCSTKLFTNCNAFRNVKRVVINLLFHPKLVFTGKTRSVFLESSLNMVSPQSGSSLSLKCLTWAKVTCGN